MSTDAATAGKRPDLVAALAALIRVTHGYERDAQGATTKHREDRESEQLITGTDRGKSREKRETQEE